MITALAVSLALQDARLPASLFPNSPPFVTEILLTVAITTAVWLVVTFLTEPESNQVLIEFLRKAQPAGPGWKRIRGLVPDLPQSPDRMAMNFAAWMMGTALVYCLLFGIGKLILKEFGQAGILLGLATIFSICIYFFIDKLLYLKE